MKSLVITGFLLLGFLYSNGQSLEEFKYLKDKYGGEGYLNVSGSFTFLSNKAAPGPSAHEKNGIVLDVVYNHIGFTKGFFNYRFDHKLITDILFLADKVVDRKASVDRAEGSSVSTGVIGWHGMGWNAIAKPKFCLAPGFAIDDYFFGASYKDSSGALHTPEPQGWYITAGPALFTHIALKKWLILQTSAAYDFAFARPVSITYAEVNDSYPKPQFFHVAATLMTPWGIFGEVQYTTIVNTGNLPNATDRLDLKLGFSFVL